MKHHASPKYWKHYHNLTEQIRKLADKNLYNLKQRPKYPTFPQFQADRAFLVSQNWTQPSSFSNRRGKKARLVLDRPTR